MTSGMQSLLLAELSVLHLEQLKPILDQQTQSEEVASLPSKANTAQYYKLSKYHKSKQILNST